ncbi:MAG: hypothetical protein J5879_01620 [Clostridia bacterium]|nr:hypothetical protein [Clostridia bacterium]
MDIRSDFHTHTNISSCGAPDNTLQALLDGLCAGPDGLRVLGVSNHLWDSDVPGASDWYVPQNVPHVLAIREELEKADTHGARVLIGAEVEFSADCRVAITEDHAKLFDYLLITANHLHMKDFIIPAAVKEPEEVRFILISRFKAAAATDLPVKCGICHPFFPISFKDTENEILAGIKDEEYAECFEIAKRHGKSIEIHSSALNPHLPLNEKGFCPEYVRMLGVAKEVGCTFHLGSDVHSPVPLPGIRLREFAGFLGIGEDRLTDF